MLNNGPLEGYDPLLPFTVPLRVGVSVSGHLVGAPESLFDLLKPGYLEHSYPHVTSLVIGMRNHSLLKIL